MPVATPSSPRAAKPATQLVAHTKTVYRGVQPPPNIPNNIREHVTAVWQRLQHLKEHCFFDDVKITVPFGQPPAEDAADDLAADDIAADDLAADDIAADDNNNNHDNNNNNNNNKKTATANVPIPSLLLFEVTMDLSRQRWVRRARQSDAFGNNTSMCLILAKDSSDMPAAKPTYYICFHKRPCNCGRALCDTRSFSIIDAHGLCESDALDRALEDPVSSVLSFRCTPVDEITHARYSMSGRVDTRVVAAATMNVFNARYQPTDENVAWATQLLEAAQRAQ